MTKNIQIIDGADNCVYYIFSASDADFARIFPDDQDVEFSDDFFTRVGNRTATAIMRRLWRAPVPKPDVLGIHGTLFFGLADKKKYYPNKKEHDATMLRARGS